MGDSSTDEEILRWLEMAALGSFQPHETHDLLDCQRLTATVLRFISGHCPVWSAQWEGDRPNVELQRYVTRQTCTIMIGMYNHDWGSVCRYRIKRSWTHEFA